ncbi:MAG TPA: glycine zipper 2TM domain-containing protein, partial [Gallionellaceae bacterium]|nr:glycine zipper 2TM domain-containing protein [Gallionellaceae bacterium]
MKIRHGMVLVLLAFAPAAFAVDGGTLVGGAIGAGAGAVIGQKLKGKDGAVAGAVIGGAVGAIIGSTQDSMRVVGPG